jgi:hypothetical protein
MSVALLGWLSLVIGAIQVIAWFAVGRNLWQFLRAHAPRLLAFRGVPYFLGTVLFLVVVPGALLITVLSMFSGSASPMIVALHLGRPWMNGLGVGLSVSVLYFGPKDLAKRRLRKRTHAVARERDGA